MSVPQRVSLIQSLVPLALGNPTALDTVLMRLLLAAFPMMDEAAIVALGEIVPVPGEMQDTSGPVLGIQVEPLG